MRLKNSIYLCCLMIWLSLSPSISQAHLLGLTPNLPTIDFSGSGIIDYNADTGIIEVSGDPSTLFAIEPFIFANILNTQANNAKNINIRFQVDHNGNFISDDTNIADMIILGSIDINGDGSIDHSGTLLTAEVLDFGFFNSEANGDDVFDLQLNNINGELAFLYSDQDIAVRIISEASIEYNNAFNNSFSSSWQGQAKGVIGSTNPFITDPIPTPIPAAFWLWASALTVFFPYLRRIKM